MSHAPERSPFDLSELRRVLIIKPSSLGDIVHTLPALHDLKTSFPHLKVTWLAKREWLPLLNGQPQLSGTLEFPRQPMSGLGGARAALRWLLELRRQCRPDVTLDFQGLLRSGLISWLTGCGKRVGLTDAREGSTWFHNHRARVDSQGHAVERYRRLVQFLGADISGPAVFPLPRGRPLSRVLPRNYIVIHPFARGAGKSLSTAQVEDFCARVELPVVLLGQVDPVQRGGLRLPENCVDLLNEMTIAELITCLRDAVSVLSVDSGPLHLAAALNPARVLGIHTWSDPRKVGPYPLEAWVWKGGHIARRGQVPAEICGERRPFEDDQVDGLIAWARGRE